MSEFQKLLRDKLMVKPKLLGRQPVLVVINEELNGLEDDATNNIEDTLNATIPVIVDLSKKGTDRTDLLKKILEARSTRVITKKTPEKTVLVEKPQITQAIKKPIKKSKKILILEDDEEEITGTELPTTEQVAKPKRITTKPERGIAILGPETVITMGDTEITKRMTVKQPPVNIKVSSYYMNNREKFVNFINSLYEPYRKDIKENSENISCDNIGNANSEFSLLNHQEIVRDYINLYTPYRGLLLYHGLGSGKTCTSIAIAEGMKDAKRVIIMTPASLQTNYREELKKCGDFLYKKNQYWEWRSTVSQPGEAEPLSAILNLPIDYISRKQGAWFVNVTKPSNYDELTTQDKKSLDEQLNEMIRNKYTFINYNGLRARRLKELTNDYTTNLFDNAVVIIDEAHNLISRIVNKLKKEKKIVEDSKGEKERSPKFLSVKLYEYLLSAKNAKVVLLTGTPVINYPNEFGILFNILRGYIKTWKFQLDIKTNNKIDKSSIQQMLLKELSLDYLDYSPTNKTLTITRNPFGFKNKIRKTSGYEGVSNETKNEQQEIVIDKDFVSDDEFERNVIRLLRKNNIEVIPDGVKIKNNKALPDDFDYFVGQYIDDKTNKLKNADALKRRILGLSSYFRSAQENLLPKYNKELGVDYNVIRIPMSDFQFTIYEKARKEERKTEKPQKKNADPDMYQEKSSTYRIFSRLFCNFVMPDRPMPELEKKKEGDNADKELDNSKSVEFILKEASKNEAQQDMENEQEGEIEGDEILENIGGVSYKERVDLKVKYIKEHGDDFLTKEALQTYSPKFLHMLENIQDETNVGLHLVYSQFRTLEGIGLFSAVLEYNGFARFKIKKNNHDLWDIDMNDIDQGKPAYALYSGTETTEEKEIIRNIYNGDWNYVPKNIADKLKKISNNNNMGEIIKVLMITSSGSEGINLRNTRYVHIMEPYWHPVRTEQVIGRARRICSHKSLPKELQTVEVFVYIMIFTAEQLKSGDAIELIRKDMSMTSDQKLYSISEAKANLTSQLTDAIKESAFDCNIYSNGKCINFGDPKKDKFSYVPDFLDQQNDLTTRQNKEVIEWKGKPITIGSVTYIYRRMSPKLMNLYDLESYKQALENPDIAPIMVGTREINEKGQDVLKLIIT